MKILVVGSGGREHALAWKLAQSDRVQMVYVAPGNGGTARDSRLVNVDMTDTMRFNPSSIRVKQGDTIRFVVKNSGQLKHEFVLGTEKELKEHYEVMKKFPEMEHADPNMVTVAPGKTGDVIWRFTKAGRVDFACLQPGHYDAGMKGAISVAAKH